ncbi:uncharacterized protein V6R79_025890 [Siganus canaliculatus]
MSFLDPFVSPRETSSNMLRGVEEHLTAEYFHSSEAGQSEIRDTNYEWEERAESGEGEHQIDGETLLSLNERMIDKLFPVIKTQVKFTRLLSTLKGKDQDVPNFNRRYPTSRQYHDVCASLVSKYPFLRDKNGQGYLDLTHIHTNAFAFDYFSQRSTTCSGKSKETMKNKAMPGKDGSNTHMLKATVLFFSEMERIHGVNLDKKLLEGFEKASSKILAETEKRKVGKDIRLQYEKALSQECMETHKAHRINAAMLLLPYLFKEHPGNLYVANKESLAENLSPSSSPALPANEGFNRDQTLFLIDLMRQHLETEGDGLPKTLTELNSRLKSARSSKRNLWKETAEKLSNHFAEYFCPDKVARKWNTLSDAYKKIKDNNRVTGKGTIRFQFFGEMDDLLGGQHDIVFPVVGTSAGLDIRRPEVIRPSGIPSTPAEAASCSSSHTAARPCTRQYQKRGRVQDDILEFLRESEDASQRRHEEDVMTIC